MCFEHRYALPIASFHLPGKYFKHDSAMHREHTYAYTHILSSRGICPIRRYLTQLVHYFSSISFLLFDTISCFIMCDEKYPTWWDNTHFQRVPSGISRTLRTLRRFLTLLHYCHFVTAFASRTWYFRSASMSCVQVTMCFITACTRILRDLDAR